MGRFGMMDEVAGLVTWLVSAECSFPTGAVFGVSAGRATYWSAAALRHRRSLQWAFTFTVKGFSR